MFKLIPVEREFERVLRFRDCLLDCSRPIVLLRATFYDQFAISGTTAIIETTGYRSSSRSSRRNWGDRNKSLSHYKYMLPAKWSLARSRAVFS